jgi:hypothetical protein
MKPFSESRKEAKRLMLLTTRSQARIGCWNVRTMFETGRATIIAAEMRRYNIAILGITESRWTGTGQLRLQTGELVLYSGLVTDNAPHQEGVAFMLSKEAQKALVSWNPVSSRIISAIFKTSVKRINMRIVLCYAPTNDAPDEDKNDFYEALEAAQLETRTTVIRIVMGDMNAKVGSDNTGYELVMGKHGLGEMNNNGRRLADFALEHDMVVGGTIFPHKAVHKATWISPDHHTENQIDHICISRTFRRSLRDVRVWRGADAASDHHLVIAKLQLKLKRYSNQAEGRRATKYNVNWLKETKIQNNFHVELSNRFEALQLLDDSEVAVNDRWVQMKTAWQETCEEILGRQTRESKPWISEHTLELVKERRSAKGTANNARTRAQKAEAVKKYGEIHKKVRKSVRRDKRGYSEELARLGEEVSAKGNLKELYDNIRRISGNFKSSNHPVRDKQGTLLTNEEEQTRRWKEHFEELLNQPEPTSKPVIEPAESDLQMNIEKPTKEEIRKAISKLNSGKAAGPDGIPAEALKATADVSTEMLWELFSQIWDTEEFPMEWKEGHIIKMPKKGSHAECSNYRGITLLSVPAKVLNRVLLERMKAALNDQLRDEQAGFREHRSCIDQISTLRNIIEQSLEWNSSLVVNFIDFEKAFDSIDRSTMWAILRHYGVPEKIVNIIRQSYSNTTSRVVHGKGLSEAFPIVTGGRQGCLLSPFMFIIIIDWIMTKSTDNRRNGIQWNLWRQLDDLDFADDLALLAHSHRQMQEKTMELETNAAMTGLRINNSKTKVMRINCQQSEAIQLRTGQVEEVDEFPYLGSIVGKTGGTEEDIKARLNKARVAFRMMSKVWKSRTLQRKTKIRIFNSHIKSVLLYGSETWRTTKMLLNRVQVFVNTCLRRILNIHWPEKISNKDLWLRTSQEPVETAIRRRRWSWLGHTLRKPSQSIVRQALKWTPQGQRRRGRPRNTWRRQLHSEMKTAHLTWTQMERTALDRSEWRQVVSGLCSTWNEEA